MKRIIYLFFCLLTCTAFLAACGKKDSVSDTDSKAQVSESSSASSDGEEGTEDLYVPDDEVINPNEEDEPGDEDLVDDADVDEPSEVAIGDASEEDDEETETPASSNTTDVQNKVSENPDETFNGSGTFNGFVDSSSVEITMSDGSYQTFFVYDETVVEQLQKMEDEGNSPTIRFTYRGISGQVNPEIISLQ
jgi:hypothetical protein